MSDTDIEKGSRSFDEIARALEGMLVVIICPTPENLTSEWLHYEAGALSKTMDPKTRVCTYLLANLESATLKPPLSWFQWTRANKSDTRKLIGTINKHLDAAPLPEGTLNATFEKWWPDLEEKLKALPVPSSAPPPRRDTHEMVAETLALLRSVVPPILDTARETAVTREKRELDEKFRQALLSTNVLMTASGSQASGVTGKTASFRNFIIHDLQAFHPEPETNAPEPAAPEPTAPPPDSSPKDKK